MAGPELISRQEDSFTFPNGSQTIENITVTSVNTARSWVRISVGENTTGTSRVAYSVTADLTSSTNIRLQRGGTALGVTVKWVLFEFDASVNVFRGSFTQSSAIVNTTVPSVDLSKSISEATFRTTTSAAANLNIRNGFLRNRLTTSTELRTNLFVSDAGSTVHWQVIEFTQDISVQQFDDTNSAWPLDVPITSVTLAKSFILFSWASNTSATLCGEDIISCRLTTSTNVRMEDFFGTGSVAKFYNFYVISYTGSDVNFDVERGYTTMFGTSISPTIAKVKSRSMLTLGHEYNSLIEVDVCSNSYDHFAATSVIDSDIQHTETRLSGSFESTVAWEVVQFIGAAVGAQFVPFHTFHRRSM